LQPSQAIFEQRDKLLAADATTLAPVALALHVHLIKAPFTPSPSLTWADISADVATFDGYLEIDSEVGAQLQSINALTGASQVTLKLPAGGWRWETTGTGDLPQAIWGFAVTDNGDTVIIGTELFAEPITLTAINQEVLIDVIQFSTLPGTMT
jgi:hypothetical protein